jgi:hypothetical protein
LKKFDVKYEDDEFISQDNQVNNNREWIERNNNDEIPNYCSVKIKRI